LRIATYQENGLTCDRALRTPQRNGGGAFVAGTPRILPGNSKNRGEARAGCAVWAFTPTLAPPHRSLVLGGQALRY